MALFPLSPAAKPPLLPLDEAIETAMRENPEIRAAHAKLHVNAAETITARTRQNPTLFSDNGIAEKTYRLGVQQTLELGGKRKKRVDVAKAEMQVTEAEIRETLMRVRAEVRRVYTRLYNLELRRQLYADYVYTDEMIAETSRQRAGRRQVDEDEVLQSEILAIQAKEQAHDVDLQIVQAWQKLNLLMNRPITARYALSSPAALKLPILEDDEPVEEAVDMSQAHQQPIDDLIDIAQSNRPELAILKQRMAVTDREVRLYRSQRVPDLTLAAGPDYVKGPPDQFHLFFIGSMQLPVFDRQQGPIQAALSRKQLQLAEQKAVENTIALDVVDAYAQLQEARHQTQMYEKEILPKAKTVVTGLADRYRRGEVESRVYFNAMQTLIRSQLDYSQALTDYQDAVSDMEKALGITL